MKRFLVCLMGDRNNYISSFIMGELSKGGEERVGHLIRKACGSSGTEAYSCRSTLRYVYAIIHGEKREDVLNEDEMEILYKASIQKYNES